MPGPKRRRIEPTDDWQQLSLLINWPEQLAYELIRPVVLFGFTPVERAHQTGSVARTIHRKADRFSAHGIASLFAGFREVKPEALVSDSGSIFKAKEAMRIYGALGIRKEQIGRKQPWQSYIETHFNVQRRMADWHVARAETWTELVASHDHFVADYNYQVHWAHRDRQDTRYSPAEVLGWVQGIQRDPVELYRIFYSTRFGRTLDKLGYVRFRHWRIYGQHGLARRSAAVWFYGETLLLEFSEEPLAQYTVSYESGGRQLRTVEPRRLFETKYCSQQQALWELGDGEWLQVLRVPKYLPKRRLQPTATQESLRLL